MSMLSESEDASLGVVTCNSEYLNASSSQLARLLCHCSWTAQNRQLLSLSVTSRHRQR